MSDAAGYIIGIPTVARRRGYLAETVSSIVTAINGRDFQRARIVILNGDDSQHSNPEIQTVVSRHGELCASGTLRIVNRYEPIAVENCDERGLWQRKQTLDCAALLEHCQDSGSYYLHVEDDVVATPQFLEIIDSKLQAHRVNGQRWAILSFYNSFPIADGAHYSEFALTRKYFGLIGQLFHNKDLPSLCHYLRAHHTHAPVDVLVARWALCEGRAVIGHSPSLFQHVGVISSFQGRIQLWDSPEFDEDLARRRARLRVALHDVRDEHPGAAQRFLSYRRELRQHQRSSKLPRKVPVL